MVFIKICGITNIEDAVAAVEAGADALGFNFYPHSPRYIKPEDARRIMEQIPPAVLNVGVFINENSPDTVARIAGQAGVGAVQLHGDESPGYCRGLQDRFVIKALRVNDGFVPQEALEYETEAILLDAFNPSLPNLRGGTGRTIDWQQARRTRQLVPKLFLAGGLSANNVAEAIAAVEPYAVDACSSLESAPGRKNPALVRAFITAAHASSMKFAEI